MTAELFVAMLQFCWARVFRFTAQKPIRCFSGFARFVVVVFFFFNWSPRISFFDLVLVMPELCRGSFLAASCKTKKRARGHDGVTDSGQRPIELDGDVFSRGRSTERGFDKHDHACL